KTQFQFTKPPTSVGTAGREEEVTMFRSANRRFIWLLSVGLMMFACGIAAAQDVHYNFMPGTDFSKFHTYKWIDIPGNVHPNQIVNQEIRQAIDQQLATKGLVKTEGPNADLLVGYQAAVDQERQWTGYGTGPGFGRMGTVTSSTIENGTLVVD